MSSPFQKNHCPVPVPLVPPSFHLFHLPLGLRLQSPRIWRCRVPNTPSIPHYILPPTRTALDYPEYPSATPLPLDTLTIGPSVVATISAGPSINQFQQSFFLFLLLLRSLFASIISRANLNLVCCDPGQRPGAPDVIASARAVHTGSRGSSNESEAV